MSEDKKTPPVSEQGSKDAMNAGGDASATKEQRMSAGLDSGEISTAPVTGKVIKRKTSGAAEADLPTLADNSLTVVNEDVYEEFYLDADETGRPLYRLRFARGQVVLTREYEAVIAGEPEGFTRGGTAAPDAPVSGKDDDESPKPGRRS